MSRDDQLKRFVSNNAGKRGVCPVNAYMQKNYPGAHYNGDDMNPDNDWLYGRLARANDDFQPE